MENTEGPLLDVKDLRVKLYDVDKGVGWPVDGVNFKINKGEVLGLTGESASGKTTIAFSILRLIGNARTGTQDPQPRVSSTGTLTSQREITEGKIIYKGQDLLTLPEEEMTRIRGKEISMIFQNPISAMNPMMTIGYQVGEPKEVHERLRWEKIREMVFDYLGKVELADVKRRYHHDPYKFSVGEGQRIMIAMALICNPSLLIADEPTSSLDMTIQRQVLELIKKLRGEFDLSVLYISHDLGVIFEMSDHVAVMYAGNVVEYGAARRIWEKPRHPYTKGLKNAYPYLYGPRKRLKGIPGSPPTPFDKFSGCKFYPRCDYANPICNEKEPPTIEIKPGHIVSCLRAYEI
ncbi:MAG: Trehalose/maltose import ATP-binding protein MalK [Candidatus Bathyarchaeota archaeon BA1]|nr:MAG: Trehalose/maltose import ATP-binding protein MalK [Candidatus Bathyarchaeota archaeon BA1]